MPERGKRRSFSKAAITKALARLKTIEVRLSAMESRVRQGFDSGLDRVAELKARGLESEAKNLAMDLAAKKMLLEEISRIRLGLEKMRLRLEAMLYLGESREKLKEIKEVMKELKSSGIGQVPEFSLMLEELEGALMDLEEGFGSIAPEPAETTWAMVSSEEVERVLREAEAIAQKRERSRFPHPPGSG